MNTEALVNYLTGVIDPRDFIAQLKTEVDSYSAEIKKIGGSSNIHVSGECKIYFDVSMILLLAGHYSADIIEWDYVRYMCDFLTLYENVDFSSDDVLEAVEYMSETMEKDSKKVVNSLIYKFSS